MPPMRPLADARDRAEGASLVATRLGTVRAAVRGSGPHVVLIHGVTESADTWLDVAARLAPHATTHAIDLPGHGLTDIPAAPLGVGDAARWVVAYLEAAAIERAVVVGWSLGGGVALGVAHQAPERVRGLVLLGSIGVGFPMPFALGLLRLPGVGEWMPRIGRRPLLRRVAMRDTYARGFRPPEAAMDRYWGSWGVEGRAPYLRALLRTLDAGEPAGWLASIAAPTRVVHGDEDRLVPVRVAREVAARLPRATLRVLERTGHAPHLERPDEVHDEIAQMLTRDDGAP